jgi:predicted nucleic acid-binding protein
LTDCANNQISLVAPPTFEGEADGAVRYLAHVGKITSAAEQAAFALLDALPLSTVHDPHVRQRARDIARQFNLPKVYDATYAALAALRGCEFWTADQRFFNAVSGSLTFVKFIGNY